MKLNMSVFDLNFFCKTYGVELHAFCDSSEKAFSFGVYQRFTYGEVVYTLLVSAKSLVAPIKQITISGLEIQATVMLSRLINYVKERKKRTDSRIVLHWIRRQKRIKFLWQ